MFAAIVASLLFTFVVATLAAKSRKAELVIMPALDILQSVPVLGFLTFTVTFFMGLFPGQRAGRRVRLDLRRSSPPRPGTWPSASTSRCAPCRPTSTRSAGSSACRPGSGSGGWSCPSRRPALVWNTMMSMSGGWFFVVASEAITVGNTTVTLPGIGSWLAAGHRAAGHRARSPGRSAAMAVVILLYDQLLFRPIVAWADKFRFEQTASQEPPQLLVLRPAAPHAPVPPPRPPVRRAGCALIPPPRLPRAAAPSACATRRPAAGSIAPGSAGGRRRRRLGGAGRSCATVRADLSLHDVADRLRPRPASPWSACWC